MRPDLSNLYAALGGGGQTTDPNNQEAKENFFKQNLQDLGYLANGVVPATSPYELKRGSVIPATLITGINSDLPGRIIAQVSQNVFDSVSGHYLLIPQGSRLFGRYDSKVTFGQRRALVIWTDIVFPNGATLQVAGMAGTDAQGYGGFADQVDNHYFEVFGSAIFIAAIGAGIDMALPQDRNLSHIDGTDAARRSFAETFGRVADRTIDKNMDVQPTIEIRPAGRSLFMIDSKSPEIGFNVLDWVGQFGGTKEEDIVAIAAWIVTDNPRQGSARDDFFRASALQLVTALLADVCLSGHTQKSDQHLRQVRANLAEPEPKLRERLQAIYDRSASEFVKENVAPFIAMTPETFSGVYANAVKETHWLSYPNYAALVSGDSFTTDELADGNIDIFVNLDLKTLETHPGLARVIIGALMNALYNRHGPVRGRTLFLLDEVARLGYLRILETARDAGRKYGITLLLLFQSIGQMREAYGGRDAASKWFESASWISFAAINDPETADYISRRCGDTTVEVDQLSRSAQMSGSSRTRSKQLTRRPLILPHEVLRMRADEQIVFTAGNPPLRCGRSIWFRRADMRDSVRTSSFETDK